MTPEEFRRLAEAVESAVGEVVVGQREAVRGTLICLVAGGHALLEGVPGLGKTTLARAFAAVLGLRPGRVQFTPDLMPADITGTTVLDQAPDGTARLRFRAGPVFANVVVADEINRAAPRTQSALLEAMQEGRVTVGNESHVLPTPFVVLATQNPVEMQGTYPLPEAELDRFLLKLNFAFPTREELSAMVTLTADRSEGGEPPAVAGPDALLRMSALARAVPVAPVVVDYATRLVLALHPELPGATTGAREHVRLGPSPRGAQALVRAGRVAALMDGRLSLSFEDVRAIAPAALRHRLILGFDAARAGVDADEVVAEALDAVATEA
jgi:MoxR-like ATPase